MSETVRLGVIGIDHRHIYGMLENMLTEGCVCDRWWTDGEPATVQGFEKRFQWLHRVETVDEIVEDEAIDMVLIASVPADRAAQAIMCMEAGKDVMVDKPGCTTLEQLRAVRECVARTGRIWTVNFSERFEVPAVTKAAELVAKFSLIKTDTIGTVKQTLGIGPHRQNLHTRPDWFFQTERFGGILCDIGCHQIDQFLFFTGSQTITTDHAKIENTTMPNHPGFQDFGELVLSGDKGHGYIRVDWFTPDALPTWGDGRLFILGDEGQIELRKYTDLARQKSGNHLYLVNGDRLEHIDCTETGMPYFGRLVQDIQHRTETAVGQEHTFKTMELAIQAQMMASEEIS